MMLDRVVWAAAVLFVGWLAIMLFGFVWTVLYAWFTDWDGG